MIISKYNQNMQERESYNGVTLPIKRLRDQDSNFSETAHSRLKDLEKVSFQSEIHQSGKVKVFWYFDNLQNDLDNNSQTVIYSDWFQTGDAERWKLVLFPYKKLNSTGLYAQLAIDGRKILYRRAAHVHMKFYVTKFNKFDAVVDLNLSENFRVTRIDWGFDEFIEHEKYLNYLRKPTLIEATISPMSPHEDSKYITDYVGIINEGTTCYVNSLLQTLYFLTSFRKAVYQMPTSLYDTDKLPLSLQLIFYHLQFAAAPASTRDLLTSFGWNSDQWNIQHDIQEFNCILADNLDKKMKGTASEGIYAKMFLGKMKNVIKCINVDFQSYRVENFSELQLNVKGCKDIYESLDKYIESEDLIGDNQYDSDEYGKQDARKEVIFESLPPVLQIQLKRFEYDPYTNSMAKVNDKFIFYEQIELSKYVENSENCKYQLFSILVHTGTTTGGHYFAYISPKLDGKWYKFNDDSVDNAILSQALEANFGGEITESEVGDNKILKENVSKSDRSAYMLVYIHSASKSTILEEIFTVPPQLHLIYEEEIKQKWLEEKERAEKNSKLEIFLVARDMILGWDKPGISPPDSSLYPKVLFSESNLHRYKLQIPKYYKGKELRAELSTHIIGEYRLWTFTPGYRNWEFKELKFNDSVEAELVNKALFIDIESEKQLFKLKNGCWEFENTIEVSTNSSQDTELIEECTELQTPSHAKAIVAYKWYQWNNGQPKLTLFKLVTLTSTANMSKIREDLYTNQQFSKERLSKMILHLEKCKIADIKNKEQIANIHTYKLEDNYELTISKRGNFGVKHVIIDNGDTFIGEIPPDIIPYNYIDAKRYISSICDDICIKCIYYNKYQDYGYESFGSKVLNYQKIANEFVIKTKLSFSQSQLMSQLADFFEYRPKISFDQIQIYAIKSNSTIPVLLNHLEEENKLKKNPGAGNIASIVESSNCIYFDILPFPLQILTNKALAHIWLFDDNFLRLKQYYIPIKTSACIRDIDLELKHDISQEFYEGKTIKFSYILLNYPQFAIVKELESNQLISVYANNPSYVLGMKIISIDIEILNGVMVLYN